MPEYDTEDMACERTGKIIQAIHHVEVKSKSNHQWGTVKCAYAPRNPTQTPDVQFNDFHWSTSMPSAESVMLVRGGMESLPEMI
jgi:hypothetical protein